MIQQKAEEYLQKLSELMLAAEVSDGNGGALTLNEGAEQAVQMILSVGSNSRKIMLVGNGGSSSVVSHVQNDLCKAVGVRAMVFTEQPLLTALANDHGYETAYERPVEWWAEPGDLLLAVSSSGKSENILRAVRAALDRGCQVITFSGFGPDNPLRRMGELNFYVSSDVYGHVETSHAGITHFLTDRAMTIMRSKPDAQVGV